jgi:Arc/MetJ family transcription regulator
MRTNIVLDDDLLAEAMKYCAGRSKKAVVREALATYVTVKAEQQRTASYRERMAIVRRRVADLSLRKTAQEMVREDRERRP